MMPPLCCTRFILSFACSLVPYQCQYEDATVESDAIIGTHQNVTFRDSHGTKHILICWSMFCNLPRRWMCRDQRRWIYLKVGIYKNYIFMSTLIFPYCKRWVSLCLASMLSINHAKTKSNNCQQQRAWGENCDASLLCILLFRETNSPELQLFHIVWWGKVYTIFGHLGLPFAMYMALDLQLGSNLDSSKGLKSLASHGAWNEVLMWNGVLVF